MRWIGLWRASVAVMVAATLAAGCGGEESDDAEGKSDVQTPAAADAPKGQGSPQALTTRVAELLVAAENKQDCDAIKLVNSRSFYRFDCPAKAAFRESLRQFHVTGGATFGSAAVIDYRSGAAPDGASTTLFVGPSGEWGIGRFGLLYGKTVGTSDARSQRSFDSAVTGYLRAVASRNCKLYRKHAATFASSSEKGCKDEFIRTSALGAAVAVSKGAKPRYLGGNRIFRFYSVTLRKPRPRYFTLSVIEASSRPRDFVVLDAAPGPPQETRKPKPPGSAEPVTKPA